MNRAEADVKLDKALKYLARTFGGEVAFGLLIIVPTDATPTGELAYAGTLTIRETWETIEAYIGDDEEVLVSPDDDDDTPPTLN
jgi:hypothetical protein